MARTIATLLMFDGVAEQAMRLYVSLFSGSEIKRIERYGPGEQGAEGTVKRADFVLDGHHLMCIDSPVKHSFTFTPSVSIFVECLDEAEQERAFQQLSEGGAVLMPLDNYGFSGQVPAIVVHPGGSAAGGGPSDARASVSNCCSVW